MAPASSSLQATSADRDWPRSGRIAGALLVGVGVVNALAGGVALVAGTTEFRTPVALGLLGSGVATIVVGWLVRRGSRAALYVALAVFEVLLIARIVTAGGHGGALVVSFVLLVVLVAVLGWAAIDLRRQHRRALTDDGT